MGFSKAPKYLDNFESLAPLCPCSSKAFMCMLDFKDANTPADNNEITHMLKIKHMLKCFSGLGHYSASSLTRVRYYSLWA